MPLSDIRDEFIRKSGRYDLGTIGGADNGANWYINSGQRMLDRRMANEDMMARRLGVLEVGAYLKVFGHIKSIKNVWLIDSENTIVSPERRTFQQITDFYKEKVSAMDTGTPAYWAPAFVRLDPNVTLDELPFTIDSMTDFVIDAGAKSNGIIFTPPTDTEYTIDILGKFYSPELVKDGQDSIWSELYPNLLVYAALYELEVTHRNTAGARDWMDAIDNELIGIDMDGVEFLTDHIDQMGG